MTEPSERPCVQLRFLESIDPLRAASDSKELNDGVCHLKVANVPPSPSRMEASDSDRLIACLRAPFHP